MICIARSMILAQLYEAHTLLSIEIFPGGQTRDAGTLPPLAVSEAFVAEQLGSEFKACWCLWSEVGYHGSMMGRGNHGAQECECLRLTLHMSIDIDRATKA